EGEQLAAAGVTVVGPRRALPSGGFTFHSPAVLWRDVRAGLLGLTLRQAAFLRGLGPRGVVVVGDVYAQAHAALVPAPRRVLQTLVSVHHGGGEGVGLRWFMEGFRGPELALLRRAQAVYARDDATAAWLRARGVPAAWVGNPMMDGLDAPPLVPRGTAGAPSSWRRRRWRSWRGRVPRRSRGPRGGRRTTRRRPGCRPPGAAARDACGGRRARSRPCWRLPTPCWARPAPRTSRPSGWACPSWRSPCPPSTARRTCATRSGSWAPGC